MNTLKDKVAVVTGGASGIGRAVALMYAREGAKVVVSDLNEKGGNETREQVLESGGEASFILGDVTDPADCENLVRHAVETYGRLDCACNNAGIGGETKPTADQTIDCWRMVIDVNLSSVFYCMKYQIPAMLKNGGGSIVNMSSILGRVAFAGSSAYTASKHGLLGLTKSAAVEYAPQGIRVNTVGPAFISTPLIQAIEEDTVANEALVSLHPIGRLGRPEEVAELVVWLSSDKASYVTGSYYPVDGGYLAR